MPFLAVVDAGTGSMQLRKAYNGNPGNIVSLTPTNGGQYAFVTITPDGTGSCLLTVVLVNKDGSIAAQKSLSAAPNVTLRLRNIRLGHQPRSQFSAYVGQIRKEAAGAE